MFSRLMGQVSVATLASLMAPAAIAQEATYSLNIEAQALSGALRAYAQTTGEQIIFNDAEIGARQSQPLVGQFTSTEALRRLLEGTGLTQTRRPSGVIVIQDPNAPNRIGAANNPASSADDEIVVTGTRLNRARNGFPVNTYSRQTLEESGQPDLGSFLSTLNEVSIVTPNSGPNNFTNRNTTVQLRGLPIGTTLTLVNGRRAQSSSSASTALFFDLNSIPYSAIERVDIVPVGSSAIYGGDALAGVVNVILKQSFEGLSLSANLGFGDGTENRNLAFSAGRAFARGSILAIASWSETTPLTTLERDFFLDADYRRFGGPDARVRQCTPGTVTSATSANLPGLNSTVAGIPDLAPGATLTIESFSATAGLPNLCSQFSEGSGSPLIAESESYSLHLAGEYRITDQLSAFGEVSYNREASAALTNAILLNNILVPSTNAFNPFGVDLRVTAMLGLENGMTGRTRETEFMRALVGLRGALGRGWDFETSIMTARDETESLELNTLISANARTLALASADPSTALNPFTSNRAANETVLRGIWADRPARGGESQRDQFSVFARGDIGRLWAGPLHAVIGAETAKETWITDGVGFNYDTKRTSNAVFAEVLIPLLVSSETSGGRELATLSLAGRWDSFSDFGEASTYQAGLELQPAESLRVRLATATSFKPPSLLQLNPSPASFPSAPFALRDPRRNNEAVLGATVSLGPNPALDSETGAATTFGILWDPPFAPGLRLGATAWRVEIDGLISLLPPQLALDFEDIFPALITRAPSIGGVPGPVTEIGYQYVNYGSVNVSGVDFEASFALTTALGQLNLSASASRTNDYESQIAPGTAIDDRLNRRFIDFWAPEWKGRVSAGLDLGAWRIGVAGRYVGPYLDAGVSTRELGDRWTYDLSGGVDLFDDRARLLITIANLTNQEPQFAGPAGGSYDPTQGDWRGRYTSLRLSTTW